MYFVDRSLLEQRLAYIDELQELLSRADSSSTLDRLALERACHMLIESMMDTGNQIIDGFIMRDPGSFEDIVDIMVDETVLTEEEGHAVRRLLPWRKELLQQYHTLDHAALMKAFRAEEAVLRAFPAQVKRYLEQEMGPVSAFIPKKEEDE
ncbi:DUF86 domain-containing protein [Alkalicoccus chagannorensis]|uniref:DUF86 domain-containing protein n=1 Tax=Alkalicoccus chagannorensis TaxID=427072 RepID=UPI000402405B|nr:DUF86 domain-containing protein [Alkalicoccus chagannorensis]